MTVKTFVQKGLEELKLSLTKSSTQLQLEYCSLQLWLKQHNLYEGVINDTKTCLAYQEIVVFLLHKFYYISVSGMITY